MFDYSPLKTTGLIVTFKKKNGEIREMKCTTNFDYIPESAHPYTGRDYSNPEVKRVFDLDKNDWRSFRYDSVISVEPI